MLLMIRTVCRRAETPLCCISTSSARRNVVKGKPAQLCSISMINCAMHWPQPWTTVHPLALVHTSAVQQFGQLLHAMFVQRAACHLHNCSYCAKLHEDTGCVSVSGGGPGGYARLIVICDMASAPPQHPQSAP